MPARYACVCAVGVGPPLSGYWAGELLGLSVAETVAPSIGKPVASTAMTRAQRRRYTLPPAAGTKADVQSDLCAGSCARSIVTAYRNASDVPSTVRALCWPGTSE